MTALTVLVVGATGSIGRHVVTEAAAAGHRVRALVRSREPVSYTHLTLPTNREV